MTGSAVALSGLGLLSAGPAGPVLDHGGATPAEIREKVGAAVQTLLSRPEVLLDLKVEHIVEDGMYMRKLYIPKGTLLIGKIHLKSCINVVAKGSISVLTEQGSLRMEAGFTAVSARGVQKVGLAHEDTVFINVFRTDQLDVDAIEAEVASEFHCVPAEVAEALEE